MNNGNRLLPLAKFLPGRYPLCVTLIYGATEIYILNMKHGDRFFFLNLKSSKISRFNMIYRSNLPIFQELKYLQDYLNMRLYG